MSGLVNLDEPAIVSTRHVDTWPRLVDLEIQSAWLANAASYSNNGTNTLLDTFFFYQNSNYSLPPISRPVHEGSSASTWAVTQDIYWAELSCVEAQSTDISHIMWVDPISTEKTLRWNVRKDKFPNSSDTNADSNCQIEFTLNSTYPTAGNGLSQIRHWEPLNPDDNSEATSTLNSTGCNSLSLMGLIIEFDPTSRILASNATIFGCTNSYLRANAAITLPTNSSVANIKNISSTKATLSPTELDISNFRNLLFTKYLQNDLALWDNGRPISLPGTTGVNDTLLESFISPISIAQYERDVSQLWNKHFVVAFNHFFDTAIGPMRVNAILHTATIIYSVIGKSAILAEAILFLAFVLLVVMSFLYPLRPNLLQSDPGSIAAQCALITDKLSSLSPLTPSNLNYTRATPRQLRRFARTLWCKWIDGPEGKRIDITPRDGHISIPASEISEVRRRTRPLSRPHFLTLPWFLLECLLMAGVLGTFGVSFQFIRVDKFDSSDSTGTTVLAYFLIYGPTVIASMISSLFASVHRHVGYMEPWVQLQKGMALATQSLTVNYCAYTPVTVWKQLRENRPPLLVILSFVCILDFVLTIVSSGMFEPSVEYWTEHTDAFTAQYNGSLFFNPDIRPEFTGFGLISDSLATGNSLLSWNTPSLSFFSLDINDPDAEWTDWTMYTTRTRGIGIELQCGELSPSQSRYSNISGFSYWDYTTASDTKCTAELVNSTQKSQSRNTALYFTPSMNSSLACQKTFLVSLSGSSNATNTTQKAAATESPSVFHCSPKLIIQDFEVRVDPDGMIHSSTPIPNTSVESGSMFQNASDSLVPFSQAFIRQGQANYSWAGLLTTQVYTNFISDPTMSYYHSQSHSHSGSRFKAPHGDGPKNETQRKALWLHTLQAVYKATFSTYTTLQRDIYLSPLATPQDTNTTIAGTVTAAVWEISPSNTTIVIIIILISLDLCVLVAVFWLRHDRHAGPPIPRSVGSLVPWISNSRMLNDIRDTAQMSQDERKLHLQRLGHRYRFGKWAGADGRVALDHDEKLMAEDEYEMNEWQLPTSYQVEDTRCQTSSANEQSDHE
ncbi:hypothetical protein N7490_000066 [Penicillium lividum]|nr:hypothetical protein N7490_000066 [Penicillium lividum]